MKKKLYFLFVMLSLGCNMATQNVTKSLIIASTLVLSNKKYDKSLSLDLHYAVERQDYTLVQKLITNPQVDVNAKVDYQGGSHNTILGCTPLIWCSWKGDEVLEIAKALVEHKGIKVNAQTNKGTTPLIECCWRGDEALETAKTLLDHEGIKVNLQNKYGITPLIMCCSTGDRSLQIAKALLGRNDIEVNLQNNNGWTPLDTIVYRIVYNNAEYQYVNLWNVLVGKGAVLDGYKTNYKNLYPCDFEGPQKGYIQSVKSNPPNPTKVANNLLQESNLLRKELEVLKKTTKERIRQLETDKSSLGYELNTTKQVVKHQKKIIHHHIEKISSLQDQLNKAKDRFGVFKQRIKQKTRHLKDETKKTITRLNRSQKNLEKARAELKNMLHSAKENIEEQGKVIKDYFSKINDRNNTIKRLTNEIIITKQEQKRENDLLRKELKRLRGSFDEELSFDLCDAIDDKDWIRAEKLIENPKVNINIKDENGLTPLLWCCLNGDTSLKITKLLLSHSEIEISVKDNCEKNALHHTCSKGALHSLELLLKQSAIDPLLNQQDHEKKTPLDILFDEVTGKHSDIKYAGAWSMLVVTGATLDKRKKDYENLNPNNFRDPQKTYVRLIKQNPPKSSGKSKLMEEDTKDDE